jgi:ribonuclease P protein component
MRREQRLRNNADFVRVRREGRSWPHSLLVLFAAPGPVAGGTTRIGVTVGRWAGNAVVRNRARRRVREAVRLRYDRIAPGWDLVFLARPGVAQVPYAAIAEAVAVVLGRAGVLGAEI